MQCFTIFNFKVKVLPTQNRLLFVHQTSLQQSLIQKYGNHICLLDATYKTTRYAIPLFFLVVKTNSDYQVVGSFAVQDETTIAITEALGVLKSWNPGWSPKCFMVDNCEEEISSIEGTFPGMCKMNNNICNFKTRVYFKVRNLRLNKLSRARKYAKFFRPKICCFNYLKGNDIRTQCTRGDLSLQIVNFGGDLSVVCKK